METNKCWKCGKTGVFDCTKLFFPFKDGEKDGVQQFMSIALVFRVDNDTVDVAVCRDCAIVYLKTLIGHFEKTEMR